jgi:ribosome-associated translation inhibitor RaiA
MITNTEFSKLSVKAQNEIRLDGLLQMKIQARKFSTEMHILNNWLSSLHTIDCNDEFVERFITITRELAENIDTLTERVIQHGKVTHDINNAFQLKKLSDRLTKTPQ